MMTPRTCWYKDVCVNAGLPYCTVSCIRFQEMCSLCKTSGLPENKWIPVQLVPDDVDVETFEYLARIKKHIDSWVKQDENLYLYSRTTGNGKTTWAIKLLLAYFNKVWAGNGFRCRGLFIHTPTFLTQLKDFNSIDVELERIKDELPKVDLVVWDDIASTNLSNYDHSQLLTYLDHRILANKRNIFTGNLNFDEMNKALGTRLTSRMWNSAECIEFYGGDKR